MKILIVDDENANVALLQYILLAAGFPQLRTTTDPREAMTIYEEFQPDLILLDLMMPTVDGFEIMRQLDERVSADDCLPVLVLTADVSAGTRHRALKAGASDFLTKPFDQVEVLLRIRHLLHIRAQHQQLARQKDTLEETVGERTVELRLTLSKLEETVARLRDTQQQVIQHERMSALGSMAAGLAHDFNNALSLILGYSELLQTDLKDTPFEDRSDEFLGTIITAAQDAAKMFNRLRDFYRPPDDDESWQPVEVNEMVRRVVALTRPRWHGQALGQGVTIELCCELAPGLPELLADAAELREMLTNLIFNAVDALPEGGTITLRTALEAAPAADDSLGTLVLEVADTGVGMSEETRRRCLEPFFTTKGTRGTGLGLAMVYGTLQRHGGSIDLRSAPGAGTRFSLRFPLRRRLLEDELIPLDVDEHAGRRILVVDDQEPYLRVLRHYLTGDGHRVETAVDGREALEKFRAADLEGEGFDLVITDKAMPGMNGEQLAATIKAMARGTAVILLTGLGVLDEEGAGARSESVDLALLKPITQADLRASVYRVMAGHPVLVRQAA